MKIQFSTGGDSIRGISSPDSKEYKKVNKIFDCLTVDLPAVPYVGQTISLAKDGICLEGTVRYVHLNWYGKGNGIYIGDEEERCYYFVRLENMEIIEALDGVWDE